jgi:hypothetical protein
LPLIALLGELAGVGPTIVAFSRALVTVASAVAVAVAAISITITTVSSFAIVCVVSVAVDVNVIRVTVRAGRRLRRPSGSIVIHQRHRVHEHSTMNADEAGGANVFLQDSVDSAR